MKKSILASLVLLCAALNLPVYANTNGVYVHVTDAFYGFRIETQRADFTEGKREWFDELTVAHRAFYACNGSGSFTELREGERLRYCSRSAEVKLVWKRETTQVNPGGIGPISTNPTHVAYTEDYRVVDDGDAGHCDTGEAVIWDVGASGSFSSPYATASMRSYCQYCAYTGGECE